MGSTLHYESENGAERFSRVHSHSEDCGQHSCGWTQRVSWCRWHTAWLQAVVPSQTATCRCVEIARVTIPADSLSHSALQTSRTTARPSCPPAQASHLPANQQTSFIPSLAAQQSTVMSMSVCLSAYISQESDDHVQPTTTVSVQPEYPTAVTFTNSNYMLCSMSQEWLKIKVFIFSSNFCDNQSQKA